MKPAWFGDSTLEPIACVISWFLKICFFELGQRVPRYDEVLDASDVDDEDDDGAGGGEDAAQGRGVQGMDVDAGEDDANGADGATMVKAADIDAYWLQREIATAFGYTDAEAAESSKLADEVLQALAAETDDERACENRLVLLLDLCRLLLSKASRH